MKQTIEIEVPDGKKAVWKDGKVIFENIKPQLPKTWEEFCEQTPLNPKEVFITQFSGIVYLNDIQYNKRGSISDRNLLEMEEDAVIPILFIASYIVVVLFIIHIQRPAAIDVYKGKTTLEKNLYR